MSAVGKLFSGPGIKEAAITPMPAMNTFDQRLKARQDQYAAKKKRKGRDETIKTAGQTYTGSNLGGTA